MSRARTLLEREAEFDLLTRLLHEITVLGGRVVLVRGEAGIGKTALVREFLARSTDDAHILFGRCDDLLTARPLGPFWDMARRETSLLEPLGNGVRSDVLDAILDLMERGIRPTIVVIEDTQWADEATMDTIRLLGRRIDRTTGLLLLTFRDEELALDHPLRGVIGDLPPECIVRIRLAGLSLEGVSTLIEGSGLDPQTVFEMTDGNPFLVIEFASAEGQQPPRSVQDSVMARVGRLTPEAQRMLRLLSVIPERLPREEVTLLTGGADEAVEECERRGLLRTGTRRVGFRHELIRRAVEASLTSGERVALNEQILDALPPSTNPARVVHHARQANDITRLLESAPEAARAATVALSYREAVEHYRLLAPYLDLFEERNRARVLEEWAWTEAWAAGLHAEAFRLCETALTIYRHLSDVIAQSRCLADMAYFQDWIGNRAAADRLVEEAIEVLGPEPDKGALAHVLDAKAWLATVAGDHEAVINLVDEILDIAGSEIDDALRIRLEVHRGTAANIVHYPDGKEILDNAHREAEALGVGREIWRSLINHADPALEHRDLDVAAEYARMAIDAMERQQRRLTSAYGKGVYARVLGFWGRWEEAEDLAREALEASLAPIGQMAAIAVLGEIEARQGRIGAEKTLRDAWQVAVGFEEFDRMAPIAAALAEYGWITDSTDIPTPQIRAVMESAPDKYGGWAAGAIAFWLWRLGELSEIPMGIGRPYRLMIDRAPLAAADLWKQRRMPYERAMALSLGDHTAQVEALKILDSLGATAVADKLRAQMRSSGQSVPRRKPREDRDHGVLTARQSEVLSLLTEGLSNLEIADRLFLSPRTVEHHVAAVMSKLNASTRQEAVAKAAETELLPV